MRIQRLWNLYRDDTIFVIGTGPSMRLFPKSFWEHMSVPTIALNQAWRYGHFDYNLTAHPELYLEYAKEQHERKTEWIIKKKAPMADLSLDDPNHFVYETEENWDLVRKRVPDKLFLGRGIQCTAISLAAHMGAKMVVLVGCDMCDVGGDHHGHDQHIQFHGLPAQDVYAEYRKWTAKTRRIVRDAFNTQVVTLSPFIGVGHPTEDYHRLCQEMNLPKLPPPKDVSSYTRKRADL